MDPNSHQPVAVRCDARGVLFEPVDADVLMRQRNCHVVLTEPGAVRGNHWHRHATEVSVVLGPARVCIRRESGIEEIQVPDGQAWRFVFPPGISHAMQNTGGRPMVVIAFSDQVHDRQSPDVVSDILIGTP